MRSFKQDTKKFKELILYICEKSAMDKSFGATKLNKILFFSDFWTYALLGNPITGVEYMKLPFGPAPRPLLPIRRQMEKDGELAIQETNLDPEMARKRPINLRAANLSEFSGEEIAVVDNAIDFCRNATAQAVSRYSHSWHGWRAARDTETIPYETVFISDDPLTEFEIARGKEVAASIAKHAA
jgi:antitoxin SocA-like protein